MSPALTAVTALALVLGIGIVFALVFSVCEELLAYWRHERW